MGRHAVPFAIVDGSYGVTSCFGVTYATRRTYASRASFDSKTQFVELPDRFCDLVPDISRSLSPIALPSQKFTQAIEEVKQKIAQDIYLADAVTEFERGETHTIVFKGVFNKFVGNVTIKDNAIVGHLEKEGEESNVGVALKAFNKSLPDLVFAAALNSNKVITQFDFIQSVSPQYPHVDFDGGGVVKAKTAVVFFAGTSRFPHPSIVTALIPVSEILRNFSREEIKFLEGANFVISELNYSTGREQFSEPFSIVDGKSMRWDGALEVNNSMRAINSHPNVDGPKLLQKINIISAMMIHNNMLPTTVLDDETKIMIEH